MRVSTKINLAVLSTVVCAVFLVMGNLYILSEQFKGLARSEKAQNITRMSTSLLVLTQEFVLFKSPSAADAWFHTYEELKLLLSTGPTDSVDADALSDINQKLAELKPIFYELSHGNPQNLAAANTDPDFLDRRESLIVERLIAETQVISDMGYQLASRVNNSQGTNLKGLTALESIGLASFVVVISMLVALMRLGVLNPVAKLKRTADLIRNGDLEAVCPVDSKDELGDVSRAVNQMAHSLAHKNHRLRDANVRIEAASKAKTDFLSNMSHEIRTPLNGIVGLAYLLKETSTSQNQKILLDSLEKTSRNLIDLVSDVLDISKIEAGNMTLESRTFSTLEFIDKVSGIMTGAAVNKPLELIIQPSVNLPLELIGDELRFRQIVVNLVGNAIKFTKAGHVKMSLLVTQQAGDVCRLRVEVEDTGIGISPEGQANLFQQFRQASVSVAREFGGSGLGLSLVKKLVDLMKGDLGFRSERGQGSLFWAEVEFRIPPAYTGLVVSSAPAKTNTMLLVTHSDMQRTAITSAAGLVQRSVEVLPDLKHALTWIESGKPVEGVLLDFPREQVDRQEWLDFGSRMVQMSVPCAMLVSSDDTRRLLHKGLNEVFGEIFVKPLTPLQIQNGFRKVTSPPVRNLPGKAARSGKMNLLIVDDSELNLKVLEGILIRRQATITKAKNGLEALTLLMNHDHGFDAVVMDVQMPLMDGLAATRELRKDPYNASLPIIGLTGEVTPEDQLRAMEAGMTAVLHKPLQPDELMQILKKMIRPVPA